MTPSAVVHHQSTLVERVSALFAWLRVRAIATAPADRSSVTPVWELQPLGDYRMTACATCGEVIDPLWRLCRHCGNPIR
jgi:zinc-ribbon domain